MGNAVGDKMLAKIRAIIERAEHPGTPPEEAKIAHEIADALMFKYAVDRATIEEAKPAIDREKPVGMTIKLCRSDNPIQNQFSMLSVAVAEHTRCTTVLIPGYGNEPTKLRVFGFEKDVAFFDILYTTLILHMSGTFFPKPDSRESLEANVLRLRSLGLNWLQMAEVYGWRKTGRLIDGDKIEYVNANGERKTNWQLGSFYKRTTHRAAKAAGIKLQVIQAGTSRKQAGDNWRRSAATGYVVRIAQRLEDARGKREAGADLVLKSSMDAINDMKNAEFPRLVPVKSDEYKFNGDAYRHGKSVAESADISGAARMAGQERVQIQ